MSMKRIVIGALALVGAGAAVLPAEAADYGGHAGFGRAPSGRAYGRPLFDEGMPPYGVVVEYKPAYIGRGLVYNVPPRPVRAGGDAYGDREGLRVRY